MGFFLLTWLSLQSTERTNFVRAFFSDIKEKRNFHTNCFSSTSKVRVGGNLIIICSNLHGKNKINQLETDQQRNTLNINNKVLFPASPNSFSWNAVVSQVHHNMKPKVREDSSQKIISWQQGRKNLKKNTTCTYFRSFELGFRSLSTIPRVKLLASFNCLCSDGLVRPSSGSHTVTSSFDNDTGAGI